MKFKVGDKVKVIASVETLERRGLSRLTGEKLIGQEGIIKDVAPSSCAVKFPSDTWVLCEEDLELIELAEDTQYTSIRTFDTGATRDTVAGKLSYMKALSPEVLEAYVTYLDKHRKQPDGSMREFDNWKKGIDKWTYLDSLLRHDHTVWMLMLGYKVSDNHGPVTLLDSLMAAIFNASGLAYELLIEEGKAKRCV